MVTGCSGSEGFSSSGQRYWDPRQCDRRGAVIQTQNQENPRADIDRELERGPLTRRLRRRRPQEGEPGLLSAFTPPPQQQASEARCQGRLSWPWLVAKGVQTHQAQSKKLHFMPETFMARLDPDGFQLRDPPIP